MLDAIREGVRTAESPLSAQAPTMPPSVTITAALLDWFEEGLFSGNRISEWANHAGRHHIQKPALNQFRDPIAFLIGDLEFETYHSQSITLETVLTEPDEYTRKIRLRWRTQKNGQNGEQRLFVRAQPTDKYCPVAAFLKIVRRHKLLVDNHPRIPLSIYQDTTGKIRLITATQIDRLLQATASKVYNLHPETQKEAIRRWTSHSIRVGACVLLHNAGFEGMDIKHLLRWRSETFMMYLRDTPALSQRHVEAINRFTVMPNSIR